LIQVTQNILENTSKFLFKRNLHYSGVTWVGRHLKAPCEVKNFISCALKRYEILLPLAKMGMIFMRRAPAEQFVQLVLSHKMKPLATRQVIETQLEHRFGSF
jgi:hypothetical protein